MSLLQKLFSRKPHNPDDPRASMHGVRDAGGISRQLVRDPANPAGNGSQARPAGSQR